MGLMLQAALPRQKEPVTPKRPTSAILMAVAHTPGQLARDLITPLTRPMAGDGRRLRRGQWHPMPRLI
jgi:hypothetical protein